MLRIRSEHAIGFLKGRFQSLKGLRVLISNKASHKFATYWIKACIVVHNFAKRREDEEREAEGDSAHLDRAQDRYIHEGLDDEADIPDEGETQGGTATTGSRARRLREGKARREELKAALFHARSRRAARQRGEEANTDSNDSDVM